MEQMNEQVKSLVLGYFSMINASVTENSGLFDISIPSEHQKFFRKDNLKIVPILFHYLKFVLTT